MGGGHIRWANQKLPGRELLDATAYAYDRLVEVISLAHAAAGAEICKLGSRTPKQPRKQLLVDPVPASV